MKLNYLILSFLLFVLVQGVHAQPDWKEVLKTLECANDYFLRNNPDPGKPTYVKKERPSNLWTRGVYFEGLMALVDVEKQLKGEKYEVYKQYVMDWGTAHQWTPRNGIATRDADDYCCSQTYLDVYVRERQEEMRTPTLQCVNNLLVAGDIPWVSGGQTKSEGSAGDWFWVDAIQMGLPVLSMLTRICHLEGDEQAECYAQQGWSMYETSRNRIGGGLFNEKEGLWWRDKDFVPPYKEPNGRNCYWSRGNGWVYAALVRAMDAMLVAKGAQSPGYTEPLGERRWTNLKVDSHFRDYLKDYQMMTKALMKCQREDYFWNVSLHDESHFGGPELSGTALFIYGMAWGVRHGYLSKSKYAPIIYQTWDAMVKTCMHSSGFLGYVQGTGKEPKDAQPVAYDKAPDFEDYGLGCFLLCGTEIIKLLHQ
ncbi:MAG: glycoside hydrolase family 88 protein [Bacteroidales bacterium]|nr:glycoside hydrolase family 88 protein [Bacteroidales bacterium]